jgi:uncharacterized protein (TIGR02145 family)
MKEPGTFNWITPNTGADNSSGFAGLPGGSRIEGGSFSFIGSIGFWWSSTEITSRFARNRDLVRFDGSLPTGNNIKQNGFSVRCLRD